MNRGLTLLSLGSDDDSAAAEKDEDEDEEEKGDDAIAAAVLLIRLESTLDVMPLLNTISSKLVITML